MVRALHIFINLLFCCAAIGQEKPVLLEGRIDKYPIVMELSLHDAAIDIRYFYVNKKKDIHLEGSIDQKGSLKAATNDRGDSKIVIETLDLKKTSTGYTGTWSSGKSKLPVSLTFISTSKYSSQYDHLTQVKELKTKSPYEYTRLKDLSFLKVSAPAGSPPGMDWYKEKYSGIVFPRLKDGFDATALKKINALLLEKHLMESKSSFECLGEAYGEYELTVSDVFVHKNIFSLNINVSYYCGGAHPDFGSEGLSFNGQTGDLLKLDDLFWPGKTKPPQADSDDWYEYRDKVFAPKIVELLKKNYPDQMKKGSDANEDECDYTDPGVWNFPNWHFTAKGLYLGAIFARVARVCDSPEWSVIPYKDLQPYINPGSKLKLPE